MNDELIVDVIKELSCNSTAGPDGVPVALLKNVSVEIAKPLNILFNHSINMGHVPSTWKEAAIVPIYKGGFYPIAIILTQISIASVMVAHASQPYLMSMIISLSNNNKSSVDMIYQGRI